MQEFSKENTEFTNQTKAHLNKHPFNKRFSSGPVLESNFKQDKILKPKDLNQTLPTLHEDYDQAPHVSRKSTTFHTAALEEIQEDIEPVPLVRAVDSPEEIKKRSSFVANEVVEEKEEKDKKFEKKIDPLDKYRSSIHQVFKKKVLLPEEIAQIPFYKQKKFLFLMIFCLIGFLLCNFLLFSEKTASVEELVQTGANAETNEMTSNQIQVKFSKEALNKGIGRIQKASEPNLFKIEGGS